MITLRLTTTDQIIVCGRKGTGKSTYIKRLLKEITTFILFDYHYEHSTLGYPVTNLSQLAIYWSKGVHRIIYLPHYRSFEEVEELCKYAKIFRNLVLIFDECDRIIKKQQNLHGTSFGEIIHAGRHHGVGLITATRRFADLHEAIVSQSDFIVFFSQHSAGDIERLEKEIGGEAAKIEEMPPYYFGEYSARENKVTWFKKFDLRV
jgi:hypothetical protein